METEGTTEGPQEELPDEPTVVEGEGENLDEPTEEGSDERLDQTVRDRIAERRAEDGVDESQD